MVHACRWLARVCFCLWASNAFADTVFNCAGPDGRQILQNEPCPKRSLLWLKNGTATPSTNSKAAPPSAAEPVLGMTTAQVQALLGAPAEISTEEVVEGRTVVWTYPDARVYQFDATGVLVSK